MSATVTAPTGRRAALRPGRATRPARRLTPRKLAGAVTVLGFGVTASWAGAFAAFTDDVQGTAAFGTGTINIQANDSDGPVTTTLGITGLLPGIGKYAPLKISNAGDSSFTYAMTTTTGGNAGLASALTLGVVKTVGATCDAAAYAAGSALVGDATALGSAALGTRTLAAGAAENLCLHLTLPIAVVDNALQGKSATASFTFTATS